MTPTSHTLNDEAIVRFLGGLWRLNRRMKHDISPLLETHGLDMRRFFILFHIRKGMVYPKELSETLQIPSTLLSRYIDQLAKQGLLERQIDERDSRRTRLSLTTQGQATFQAVVGDIKAYASQRLVQLPPAQLFALLEAMEALSGFPLPKPTEKEE
ncbi:MAG: MarR family winged helix-turn-helix transcriptional regulator [Deinococcus sp.]|uniref:MarR family winged helix-turn-helix transcriptional regulator n=1 Tax=Deinococcus sp. TaxID=47478 RepID=UPI0026DAA2E6|nr:MarR family winged helix-turn-helix transcriptional regulator [Deinococcus sp.]MDO4247263.1 MarR family winged helix-turn-helix transcriptional regulator [Deinococcus sp.]